MLVEQAGIHLPMIAKYISGAGRRQNIEGKILSLRTKNRGYANNPTEGNTAGNVRNKTPSWTHEVVPETSRDAEIAILGTAKNWLCHREEIHLIISAKQAAIIVVYAPTPARGKKLGANFVTVWITDDPEKVGRFR